MDLMFTSQLAYGFTPIGFLENLEFELTGKLTAFQIHDVPPRSKGSLTLCPGQGCSTTHYYKAKACNNNGCSEFTDVTGGITEVAGPVEVPPPPVDVVAREVNVFLGPNDGRVSWSATPRATYYVINEDGQ